MGQRVVRVNELLKREISQFLHTRYQASTVGCTITDVDVSPDLRQAKVYYSVIGDDRSRTELEQFFAQKAGLIRKHIGNVVVLKFNPRLDFVFDGASERSSRLDEIFRELNLDEDSETDRPAER